MLTQRLMACAYPAYALRSALLVLGSAFALQGLFAAACVSSSQVIDSTTSSSSGAGASGFVDDGTICVLHNCKSASDCGACSEGRKLCNLRDHRCVACDVTTGEGCLEGEICSDFGSCIPNGLTCDVDDRGIPTIPCVASIDCAACDPAHQVCDTTAGNCVGCTVEDTHNCGHGEVCTAEATCAPGCPSECIDDAECAACGAAEGAAFTCVDTKCVQTSSTGGGTTADGGTTTGDGGTTGNTCHDLCAVGAPMTTSCNTCTSAVCTNDAFCCDTGWDAVCVNEVGKYCNSACTIPPSTCAHNECVSGKALDPQCSSCAAQVCLKDSFCCEVTWDSICIGKVFNYCGIKCQ
jgi:hypothetical protein